MLVSADITSVDENPFRINFASQDKKILPQAFLRPIVKTPKSRLPRTEIVGHISPRRASFQFPKDRFHHVTAVFGIITAVGGHFGLVTFRNSLNAAQD